MSIKRLAAGTVLAGAAVLMLGTGAATAEIPLDTPSSTPQIQGPQPIAGLPSTGSMGFGIPTCDPTKVVLVC